MTWATQMASGTRRVMLFVDGENFTIEGTKLAEKAGVSIVEGDCFKPGVYLWLPNRPPTNFPGLLDGTLQPHAERAYYYTSTTGSSEDMTAVRDDLWKLGFEPKVFHKPDKNVKSKGVDITLSTDMLSHASHGNYDTAMLVAGDGDYVPLVDEVKRIGRRVVIAFFSRGMSPELRRHSDLFFNLDDHLTGAWQVDAAQRERLKSVISSQVKPL